MKFSITNKLKLWVILTISVVLVGMVMLGIFGLNRAVDQRASYEITVNVDQDVEGASEKAQDIAEEYFDDKGVSEVCYASQEMEDGNTKIYKFKSNPEIDAEELTLELNKGLNTDKVVATATVSEVATSYSQNLGGVIIGLAIAVVAIFVYLFFTEKVASALAVLASSVISIIITLSLMAITRIPAYPFGVTIAFAFALSAILSTVIVNRFKEEIKNVANGNLKNSEIADKGASNSLFRVIIAFVALLVVALLFILAIGGRFLFIGLSLIVVDISSVFASFIWTPVIWSALKK